MGEGNRVTRRLPENIKRVHKAWGRGVRKIDPTLGPLESEVTVYAESAIHEFCHAALYGIRLQFGKASGLIARVSSYSASQRPIAADLNEVRTLAAEWLVLQELQIDVPFNALISLGLRNTQLIHTNWRLVRLIRKARRTPKVKNAAKAVVRFIQEGTPLHEQRDDTRSASQAR
jgi:hypothetical protein